MPIVDNSAFAFTGEIKPIILPYNKLQPTSPVGMSGSALQAQRADERSEDDTTYMGVDVTKLNEGLHGQNTIQQKQLIMLEQAKNQLKSSTREAILGAKTQTERDQALEAYHQNLTILKTKAMDVQLHSVEYKQDAARYAKDEEYVVTNYMSDTPAMLLDFGGITGDSTRLGDGSSVASNKLFDEAANGFLATDKYGRAMKKSDYLMAADNNATSLDREGMPARYRSFVRSSNRADYSDRLAKSLSVSGSRSGDSFQMIGDNGNKYSVGDDEMASIMNGSGFVKTSSSSNASALKSAINNAYNRMTAEDRNTALEKLIQNGTVAQHGVVFQNGKKREKIKPDTYANYANQLQQVRQEYSQEKNPQNKEYLRKKGVALAEAIIAGTKMEVYREASGYYKDKLETRSNQTLYRATDKHQAEIGLKNTQAALNPVSVELMPTRNIGDNLWVNGRSIVFPDGVTARTNSTVLQNSYLKYHGYDLAKMDKSDPSWFKNAKNPFGLSSAFIMNNEIYDSGKMDSETRTLLNGVKVIGVDNHLRVLRGIHNGGIDMRSGKTTYIGVKVAMDRDTYNKMHTHEVEKVIEQVPGMWKKPLDHKRVAYTQSDQEVSWKRAKAAGKLNDFTWDEELQKFVGTIYSPMDAEADYSESGSLNNTRMMRSANAYNAQGWELENKNPTPELEQVLNLTGYAKGNENLPADAFTKEDRAAAYKNMPYEYDDYTDQQGGSYLYELGKNLLK